MKILLLGRNYGSVINSLHEGLVSCGHEVRSMTLDLDRSLYNDYTNIDVLIRRKYKNKLLSQIQLIRCFYILTKAINDSHVVHIFSNFDLGNRFYNSEFILSLLFRKKRKIKKFITFLGSDIRVPEIELKTNPFFKYAYFNDHYEYGPSETKFNSDKLQKKFADCGFRLICSVETERFVNLDIFPIYDIYHHPSKNNSPFERVEHKRRPIRIVHAPTAPVAKGSTFVLKAIAELEKEGICDFEFTLLKGLSNEKYVQVLKEADVLIDQLIWGWYGIATQQALQLGKIVLCNLNPELLRHTPTNPIINVDIHNLKEVLLKVIQYTTDEIEAINKDSISFYENFHCPKSVAKRCLAIYKSCF